MIKLSIIIPCYNMGVFLLEALESVKAYKGKDIEIIIVNDGSTDAETISILKQLELEGYFVVNQDNQGLAMARNNAIAISKGEYFLPLDADNKIRPEYIELGIKMLDENKKTGVVYGNYQCFGEKQSVYNPGRFDLLKLMRGNYIDACVVARKKAWQDTGGYDKNISPLADWEFHLSVAERGWELQHVNRILFDYRVRGDSMIRTYRKEGEYADYIVAKHAALYRKWFMYQASLKGQLQLLAKDLALRLTGRY